MTEAEGYTKPDNAWPCGCCGESSAPRPSHGDEDSICEQCAQAFLAPLVDRVLEVVAGADPRNKEAIEQMNPNQREEAAVALVQRGVVSW